MFFHRNKNEIYLDKISNLLRKISVSQRVLIKSANSVGVVTKKQEKHLILNNIHIYNSQFIHYCGSCIESMQFALDLLANELSAVSKSKKNWFYINDVDKDLTDLDLCTIELKVCIKLKRLHKQTKDTVIKG